MTEASKNTLAALIIGGGGGGSYALNKYLKSGNEEETKGEQEPGLSFNLDSLLNADIDFGNGQYSSYRGVNGSPRSFTLSELGATNYSDKTLGNVRQNKNKLVDPNNSSNQEWWEWSYNKLESFRSNNPSFVHAFFKNVNQAYSNLNSTLLGADNLTILNQACNKAYGLKYLDFEPHENLLDNIKEFCSTAPAHMKLFEPEDEEPKNISTLNEINPFPGEYDKKVASFGENKKHFVAATNFGSQKENVLWWKWSYKKNYLSQIEKDPTWLTDKFKGTDENKSNLVAYSDSNSAALNKICDSYYKSPSSEITDAILKSNIVIFCTKGASKSTSIIFENTDFKKIEELKKETGTVNGIVDRDYR